MATLVNIVNDCANEKGNSAGIITKAYVALKDDIDTFTVGASGTIDAITMVATKVFTYVQFEEDTAFFNQPITVNKRSKIITQSLGMTIPRQTTTKRNAIMDLIDCSLCGLVWIIQDENGLWWVAGIQHNTDSGETTKKGLYAVGSDGAQTGANRESDSNQYVLQFDGKTNEFAREWSLTEGDIPV